MASIGIYVCMYNRFSRLVHILEWCVKSQPKQAGQGKRDWWDTKGNARDC